jgi:hypothetical protein
MEKKNSNNYQQETVASTTSNKKMIRSQFFETPITIKVGQLEVKLNSLEERINNNFDILSEKINSGITNMRWIFAAVVSIVTLVVGGGTFLFNLSVEHEKSYAELQNNYYEQLLKVGLGNGELNKENEAIRQKNEANSNIINCLKGKKYWQYDQCFK